MLDINSSEFLSLPREEVKKYVSEKGTVGIIGYGYVGKAVESFFKDTCSVLVYDKVGSKDTLKEVVLQSEVVFVAVPTPMNENGSCHTDIVESVLQDINRTALENKRNLDSFVVVIKSTVNVGFTEQMQMKFLPMRIVFSPEFLTEKNSIKDFRDSNRHIVGGDNDDANVVLTYFYAVCSEKVDSNKVLLLHSQSNEAEMCKLFSNGVLASKVIFSNEIYQLCQKLGISYDDVRFLTCVDNRVGFSHTAVPGPDGNVGFGGHCFPKDLYNLQNLAKEVGVEEKMFTSTIERNNELREDKDWEKMEGRAVIKK